MVLNPALFAALRARFKTVKVYHAGTPAVWNYVQNEKSHKLEVKITSAGEQYAVSCPFCHDTRHRLEIGHLWLKQMPRATSRITHNLTCYNEECKGVYENSFYQPFIDFLQGAGKLAEIVAAATPEPVKEHVEIRMPVGCVPLEELPAGHRALCFLEKKYNNLDPVYLSRFYGACFTAEKDDLYRLAHERIIFPVYERGALVGWQGRRIDSNIERRWILPPGFRKVFYNGDRVGPTQVPIICEGITSSICCGPSAIAIFGKHLDDYRCRDFAARWPTAVIALDPTCSLPDPNGNNVVAADELKAQLDKHLKIPAYIIRWPAEAMKAAAEHFEFEARKIAAKRAKQPAPPKEKHDVPDSADYGIQAMAEILEQVPATHRGAA